MNQLITCAVFACASVVNLNVLPEPGIPLDARSLGVDVGGFLVACPPSCSVTLATPLLQSGVLDSPTSYTVLLPENAIALAWSLCSFDRFRD